MTMMSPCGDAGVPLIIAENTAEIPMQHSYMTQEWPLWQRSHSGHLLRRAR